MPTKNDITVLILREIRDEIRAMRHDLTQRIDATNERIGTTNERIDGMRGELTQRIDGTNDRLGQLEIGFLDIAQQQRFVVRYLRAMTERDHRFEADLAALRARVEAIETRLDR